MDVNFRVLTTENEEEFLFDVNSETGWLVPNDVRLSGGGVISVTSAPAINTNVVLSGDGQITAETVKGTSFDAIVSGGGSISVQSESDSPEEKEDSAVLSGGGSINVDVLFDFSDDARISGGGSISVDTDTAVVDNIVLSGGGELVADSQKNISTIATVFGGGGISVTVFKPEPTVVDRVVFVLRFRNKWFPITERMLNEIALWETWVNLGDGPVQARFTGRYRNGAGIFDVPGIGKRSLFITDVDNESQLQERQAVIFPPGVRRN